MNGILLVIKAAREALATLDNIGQYSLLPDCDYRLKADLERSIDNRSVYSNGVF